jgi:hypothetical protein
MVAMTDGYAAVWNDTNDNYLLRLDWLGAPIGQAVKFTPTSTSISNGPMLAGGDPGLGALWMSWGAMDRILFGSLDNQGNPLGPDVDVVGAYSDPGATALAWNGDQFGAAWVDYNGGQKIRFARIDAMGNVLSASNFPGGDGTGVSWDGAAWTVAVPTNSTGFDLLRFDSSGQTLQSNQFSTAAPVEGTMQFLPSDAGQAVFYLLTFPDHSEIQLVYTYGSSAEPIVVVSSPTCAINYSAAVDPYGYSIAWTDCSSNIQLTQVRCSM